MNPMHVASLVGSTPAESIRMMIRHCDPKRRLKARKIVNQLRDIGYDLAHLETAIIDGEGEISFDKDSVLMGLDLRNGDWHSRVFLNKDSWVLRVDTRKGKSTQLGA